MWLEGIDGDDKAFYTTGRLTSEMVVKCAQMKIPVLVSRSGLTQMGYENRAQNGLDDVWARAQPPLFAVFGRRTLRARMTTAAAALEKKSPRRDGAQCSASPIFAVAKKTPFCMWRAEATRWR